MLLAIGLINMIPVTLLRSGCLINAKDIQKSLHFPQCSARYWKLWTTLWIKKQFLRENICASVFIYSCVVSHCWKTQFLKYRLFLWLHAIKIAAKNDRSNQRNTRSLWPGLSSDNGKIRIEGLEEAFIYTNLLVIQKGLD